MALGTRVFRSLLRHPLTWMALATVAALEWAFVTWFQPPLAMLGAALGVGLVSLVLWPILFARSAGFAKALEGWTDDLAREQDDKLRELAADFADLDFHKGAAQLRLLREKIDNLAEVLKRRLNAGELTYGRYLGMAEQVYLSALDNLHEVAVALRSVSTIDPGYIGRRLDELRAGAASSEQERELEALSKRHALFQEQNQRIAGLIAQNESAMTVLDKTSTALAGTRTAKGQATMDADRAMAELEDLAKRFGNYAATP